MIALWGGALLMGVSMASIFPVTITLAERRMTITGQTTSWFFVGVGLGSMLMPWLIGQLFEPIGPQITMYVILVALVLDFFAGSCSTAHAVLAQNAADGGRRRFICVQSPEPPMYIRIGATQRV